MELARALGNTDDDDKSSVTSVATSAQSLDSGKIQSPDSVLSTANVINFLHGRQAPDFQGEIYITPPPCEGGQNHMTISQPIREREVAEEVTDGEVADRS